jgi:hypothetical protein
VAASGVPVLASKVVLASLLPSAVLASGELGGEASAPVSVVLASASGSVGAEPSATGLAASLTVSSVV